MKPDSLQLRKLYALAASSCLCAGSLMILKSLWDLFGMPAFSPLPAEKASELLSPAILLLVSALCLILLKWSSEKNLRLPLWGGLFLLALLAGAFLFLRERNAFAALSQEEASLVQACARNLASLPPIRLLRTAPPGTFRQNRSAALLFPSDFGNCRTALRASVIFVGKPPVAEGTSSANPDCNPSSVCRAGNSALQMECAACFILPATFSFGNCRLLSEPGDGKSVSLPAEKSFCLSGAARREPALSDSCISGRRTYYRTAAGKGSAYALGHPA